MHKMTVALYRIFVIAWAFLYTWWSTIPYSAYKQPPLVREALEHAGRGAVMPLNETLADVLLTATLISAVGLLLFHRWARSLLLLTTGFSLAHAPFAGVVVAGPLDGTLGFLLTLATGALIAVTFWSPLATRFVMSPRAITAENTVPELTGTEGTPLPEEDLVIVFETADPAVLPVIRSLLESAEIEYTTAAESLQDLVGGGRLAGYNPAAGPVRVLVRRSDAVFARDVLQLGLDAAAE